MKGFEYMHINGIQSEIDRQLLSFGALGWEAYAVLPMGMREYQMSFRVFLKRQTSTAEAKTEEF